jgi:AbrB family looped-hinge helix DNA binding protein
MNHRQTAGNKSRKNKIRERKQNMLITVDKRGSINLPASLRRQLGLAPGACLDLSIGDGGTVILQPVAVYPAIHLNEHGLAKLKAARESGAAAMPDWLTDEVARAETDPD